MRWFSTYFTPSTTDQSLDSFSLSGEPSGNGKEGSKISSHNKSKNHDGEASGAGAGEIRAESGSGSGLRRSDTANIAGPGAGAAAAARAEKEGYEEIIRAFGLGDLSTPGHHSSTSTNTREGTIRDDHGENQDAGVGVGGANGSLRSKIRGKVWMSRWSTAPVPEAYMPSESGSDDGGSQKQDLDHERGHKADDYVDGGRGWVGRTDGDGHEKRINHSRTLVILETMLRSSYRAGFNDALKLSPFMPFLPSPSPATLSSDHTDKSQQRSASASVSPLYSTPRTSNDDDRLYTIKSGRLVRNVNGKEEEVVLPFMLGSGLAPCSSSVSSSSSTADSGSGSSPWQPQLSPQSPPPAHTHSHLDALNAFLSTPTAKSYLTTTVWLSISVATASAVYLASYRLRNVERGLKETLALVQLRDGVDKSSFMRLGKELGAVRMGVEALSGAQRQGGVLRGGLGSGSEPNHASSKMIGSRPESATSDTSLSATSATDSSTHVAPITVAPASFSATAVSIPEHATRPQQLLNSLHELNRKLDNLSLQLKKDTHSDADPNAQIMQKALEGIEDLRHPLFGIKADIKEIKGRVSQLMPPGSAQTGLPSSATTESPKSALEGHSLSLIHPQPHSPSDQEIVPMFDIRKAVEGIKKSYLEDQGSVNAGSITSPASPSASTRAASKHPQPQPQTQAEAQPGSAPSHIPKATPEPTPKPKEGQHLVPSSPRDHLIISPYPPHSTRLDDILMAEKHSTPIERVRYPARADKLDAEHRAEVKGRKESQAQTLQEAKDAVQRDERGQVKDKKSEKEREGYNNGSNLSNGSAISTPATLPSSADSSAPSPTTAHAMETSLPKQSRQPRTPKKKDNDPEDESSGSGLPPSAPPPSTPPAPASDGGSASSAPPIEDNATSTIDDVSPRSRSYSNRESSTNHVQPQSQPQMWSDRNSESVRPITHWWSFHHSSIDDLWRMKGFGWYGSGSESNSTVGPNQNQGAASSLNTAATKPQAALEDERKRTSVIPQSSQDAEAERLRETERVIARMIAKYNYGGRAMRSGSNAMSEAGTAAKPQTVGEDKSITAWAFGRARKRFGEWPFH